MNRLKTILILSAIFPILFNGTPDALPQIRIVPIQTGWAKNSVNAVIFRRNSVVSHAGRQFVAFYDSASIVVLAKRRLDTDNWEIRTTQFKGDTRDAHNSISIMIDGDGFLHMAWDHHGDELRYSRSLEPGSLRMSKKMPMTGKKEDKVTYPEFYRLPGGNLLFFYRDGASGRGNLMLNKYDRLRKEWAQVQDGFVDGEGERNAYWQAAIDGNGTVHLSWVWRESGDVATNHDICYARSPDGGRTWEKSTGEKYTLPITAKSAEYAVKIPQNHELANQTSMCSDLDGKPYIASYWRPAGSEVPQYHLVYHNGIRWQVSQITNRRTPFTLKGGGTKRIPVSRPQIVSDTEDGTVRIFLIFRDSERGNRVTAAICENPEEGIWDFQDLTDESAGQWEPSYDTEMWQRFKSLHLYLQNVGQGDGEKTENIPAQMISILEWTPD